MQGVHQDAKKFINVILLIRSLLFRDLFSLNKSMIWNLGKFSSKRALGGLLGFFPCKRKINKKGIGTSVHYIPVHKLKNYLAKNMVEIETKSLKSVYQDKEGKFLFLDNEDFEKKQPYNQRILGKKTL